MEIYLVGGAVRDSLLNIPVTDRDWVIVGGQAESLLQQGYKAVGRDFPVFLHPVTHEEYALARTERKSGKGYTGFICYAAPDVTLEQDLERRDLTINAIAQDIDGNYIDPFHGVDDLKQRTLRHVSAAFREDPLRVLRVARFAARYAHLGFTIAPETMAMMQQMAAAGELLELTPERVWLETAKALATKTPEVYFQTLRDCQALAILFPEIDRLFGIPAPQEWHPEIDSGIHTMLTLNIAAQLSPEIDVRFSALCHDLGKGLTPPEFWPHHPGHGAAGRELIDALCQRLPIPNELRDLAKLVAEFHDQVHTIESRSAEQLLSMFDAIDVWRKPQRLQKLLLSSKADLRGRDGWEKREYPQEDYLQQAYDVARQVDVQQIIAEGFTHGKIRQELTRRRLAAIKQWQQANSQ